MKKFIFLFGCALLLLATACNNESTQTGAASPAASADTIVKKDNTPTPAALPVGDNSATSLDWPGTYKGTLPCADCEGIATTLTIGKDSLYTLTNSYLGKKGAKAVVKKGRFTWNAAGSTITLDSMNHAPTQYLVGENKLVQLDLQGQRITGDNAARYELQKETAALADASFTGTYWKLTELMGKPIAAGSSNKEMYVQFNKEKNRVQGNGGCNGFIGTYEPGKMNRVKFSGMASTQMACPKMEDEATFLKVFSTADSYIIKGNRMQLVKGRMAPLAIFEAVAGK